MPYAQGRTYNDADSHIMETREWLFGYADPSIRDRLSPMTKAMIGSEHSEWLIDTMLSVIGERRANPHAMKQAEAELMTRSTIMRWAASIRPNAAAPSTCSASTVNWSSPAARWGSSGVDSGSRDSSIPRFFTAVAARTTAESPTSARMTGAWSRSASCRWTFPNWRLAKSKRRSGSGAARFGCPQCRLRRCPPRIPTWIRCGSGCRTSASPSCCIWAAVRCSCAAGLPKMAAPPSVAHWPTTSAPRNTRRSISAPRHLCRR